MSIKRHYLRQSRTVRQVAAWFSTAICCLSVYLVGSVELAQAQSPRALLPKSISLLHDDQPPGAIGATQLYRNPNLRGYLQPVEFRGPKGTEFSFAHDGFFGEPVAQPARAALLVGVPYRIKVTGIPFEPGVELYPTIELIDRTYPPPEKAHRFPIPIEFDALEFEAAMRGELVTRVIYLEDSSNAEPASYEGPQRVYEATDGEDMLMTADIYGRPLAIVRLGSRIPDSADGMLDPSFMFGCPPVGLVKPVPDNEALYEQGIFQRYETMPSSVAPANPDSTAIPASRLPVPSTFSDRPRSDAQQASGRIGDSY